MTLTEMTAALNEQKPNFGGDYVSYFGMSDKQAKLIASKSDSVEEFIKNWID